MYLACVMPTKTVDGPEDAMKTNWLPHSVTYYVFISPQECVLHRIREGLPIILSNEKVAGPLACKKGIA